MKKVKKVIRAAKEIKLPMKVYTGDCLNNEPEFEEAAQTTILLSDFIKNKLLWRNHQIKLQLCDTSLWFENEFLENAITALKEHDVTVPIFETDVNWRLSGKGWRFPSHFDCMNQVIVQLYGKKKWSLPDLDLEFILDVGDILFLKMGTKHQAENLELSLILNFQYVPEILEDLSKKLTVEFETIFPIRTKNLDSGKDFRETT